jgi:hypothetical protein
MQRPSRFAPLPLAAVKRERREPSPEAEPAQAMAPNARDDHETHDAPPTDGASNSRTVSLTRELDAVIAQLAADKDAANARFDAAKAQKDNAQTALDLAREEYRLAKVELETLATEHRRACKSADTMRGAAEACMTRMHKRRRTEE